MWIFPSALLHNKVFLFDFPQWPIKGHCCPDSFLFPTCPFSPLSFISFNTSL